MNRTFLFLIIFLCCRSVAGQDYLQPIPPFDRFGYNKAVFESFIGSEYPELWMIVKPSFAPEYAVILYSKNGEYFLTSVEAKEKIWKYKKVDNIYILDIKPTKDLKSKSTSFELHELEGVTESWATGLRLTRYSPEGILGKDGTTYMFYSNNKMYGQTWSPKGGLALKFVKLGGILRQLVHSAGDGKEKLLAQAKKLAGDIGGYNPNKQIRAL